MLLYLFVDIVPGLNTQWYIRIYKCDFTSLEHGSYWSAISNQQQQEQQSDFMSTARSEFCRQIPTRIFICKYHPERHLLVRYFVIFSRKYSIYHRKTFADAVSLKAPTSTGMHVPWARQLVRDRDRISTCWRHRFSYRSTGWHAKHSSRPSRCIEKLPLHQYIY